MTGAVTAAPGSYPVTVDVSDGTDSEEVSFTIVVTQEDATATYTGPATEEAPTGGNDVVSVPLSAHVTQAADGSLGDLTKATVTIKDTIANEVLCANLPVNASGDASCNYSADIPLQSGRIYNLQLQVGGRYVGTGTGTLSVTIDHTDPSTSITSGPAEGSLLLGTAASIGIAANESPVTFTCTLDGSATELPELAGVAQCPQREDPQVHGLRDGPGRQRRRDPGVADLHRADGRRGAGLDGGHVDAEQRGRRLHAAPSPPRRRRARR